MTPVTIIGGGLAGGAAACRLARAGHPVVVLEREKEPVDKVCGEFISGGALADLGALGVDMAGLGAAPITRVRLVHHGRVAESRLPFAAAGLSRKVLDEALLQRAISYGADVRRGVRVRTVASGVVETDAGAAADGGTVFLATGKHELRGQQRTTDLPREPLIGFKLHLSLSPAQQAELAGFVEVVLFKGGYAGLQLVEAGIANLCLLVDRSRFDDAGQSWPALLEGLERGDKHLARRLRGAVWRWNRPLATFRVPYGFVHDGPESGLFRLGDQAAVIPSFCGDGMAIALHSARLAADTVLHGRSSGDYHRDMRRDAGPQVRLASELYKLSRSSAVCAAIVAGARVWPGSLRSLARRTRVAAY